MRRTKKSRVIAAALVAGMIMGEMAFPVPLFEAKIIHAENNLLNYKENGFDIENGVLRKYQGQESNVTIPEGVITIGDYAFSRNETVETVIFPEGLKNVKSNAFEYCTKLKKVVTNEQLETVGYGAFLGDSSLESIDTSHVKNFERIAFRLCKKLKNIDLSSAEIIESSAFSITGIEEVEWEVKDDLGVGTDDFGSTGIFEECTSLKKVHLKGKITFIPSCLFQGCTALEEIDIDTMDQITRIDKDAFTNTPWEKKKLEESEDHMFILNDILVKYQPNTYYVGDEEKNIYTEPKNVIMEDVVIPDTVTKIAPKAFYGAYSVRNITFPKSIKEVGDVAFDYTTWLEEYLEKEHYLIINEHLIKIWHQLEIVEIPSNVKYIDWSAYPNDSDSGLRAGIIPKAKEVIVPATVTEIEDGGLPYFDSINFKGYGDIEKYVLPKSFEKKVVLLPSNWIESVIYEDRESTTVGKDLSGNAEDDATPTQIPTEKPTITSSQAPDQTPTVAPGKTETPNPSPTAKPSKTPNQTATAVPSKTETPSPSLTSEPSKTPSQTATAIPSKEPLPSPTMIPSETPGQNQTGIQNSSPTSEPEQVPVAKSTVLTDTKNKCQVKVTSSFGNNPTVTYTKSTNTRAGSVTIPATVTIDNVTYKVTSVAASAFSGNKKVTKVTIGGNVTSIGKNAFRNCSKLKNITVKSSTLKTVGGNALKGTNKKLVIKVPSKKVSAYKKLFKGKGNSKVKVKK